MRIRSMSIKRVPVKKVNRLKLSKWTPMGSIISELRGEKNPYGYAQEKVKGTAILAEEGTKVVGWLTLTVKTYWRGTQFLDLNVYVSKKYRRKGIGTKLINRAKKIARDRKLSICPHDTVSDAFFKNFPGLKDGY